MYKFVSALALAGVLFSFSGCVTPLPPKDYTALKRYQPKSILVLPPLNSSIDANASYSYVSTATQPLAELGYYVYPVAVMDTFLKENGLPTPGEMHQIPLSKIDQIVGADAVLYINVLEYGSKYQILNSSTVVSASARLVDVKTGTELWSDRATTVQSSSQGSGGLAEMLVAAAVSQIINSSMDAGHGVSRMNNTRLFLTKDQGLLPGPRHAEFGVVAQ